MVDNIDIFMKNMKMDQYKTLSEVVYDAIRSSIIGGEIAAGQRINEKEYAERAHISRTPIREAIHRLRDEQLVEYIERSGVIVRHITRDDVIEIYQIRKALDTLATINAARHMTDTDLAELKTLLNLTQTANDENDVPTVINHFRAFNSFIYDQSKMPRLKDIILKLREYVARFRDLSLSGKPRRDKALAEHWEIYDALVAKDEVTINRLIPAHLEYSEQFVLAEMRRKNSGA